MRTLTDGELDILREIERDCRDDESGEFVELTTAELSDLLGPLCGQCGAPLDYVTPAQLCADCALDLHMAMTTIDDVAWGDDV